MEKSFSKGIQKTLVFDLKFMNLHKLLEDVINAQMILAHLTIIRHIAGKPRCTVGQFLQNFANQLKSIEGIKIWQKRK